MRIPQYPPQVAPAARGASTALTLVSTQRKRTQSFRFTQTRLPGFILFSMFGHSINPASVRQSSGGRERAGANKWEVMVLKQIFGKQKLMSYKQHIPPFHDATNRPHLTCFFTFKRGVVGVMCLSWLYQKLFLHQDLLSPPGHRQVALKRPDHLKFKQTLPNSSLKTLRPCSTLTLHHHLFVFVLRQGLR